MDPVGPGDRRVFLRLSQVRRYGVAEQRGIAGDGELAVKQDTRRSMAIADIRLIILDVDGVLTSGHVRYQGDGDETKEFHVHDGCAMKLWQDLGGSLAILSGRTSTSVQRRARELGIQCVRQGVGGKMGVYRELLQSFGLEDQHVCCVGDDLADLPLLTRCGFGAAPSDAAPAVKRIADYVARNRGGDGAVAEVIELVLRKQSRWRLPVAAADRGDDPDAGS